MAMKRFTMMLLALLPVKAWSGDLISFNNGCLQGMQSLEKSPFSLYVSCEGALGNYIGVIMSGKWSHYGNKSWDIGDRFWYESKWGKDVTSIYFHKENSALYVATSSAYGNGGLYKLDLNKRKSYLVYPKEATPEGAEDFYTIKQRQNNKLILEKDVDGKKNRIEIDITQKRVPTP